MGIIIAELAIVLLALRKLDGNDALKKFGAISMVLISMGACMANMSKISPNWGDIGKWTVAMASMTVIVALLGGVLAGLKHFNVDGSNAVKQFGAISMILMAMAGCITVLSMTPLVWTNIGQWTVIMLAMTGMVALLGGVLAGLEYFNVDGENAVKQFAAISTILLAMAGCIRILTFVGPPASAALPALGTLALFAIGLTAFLAALGGIDKYFNGGFADVMDRAVDIMTKLGQAIGSLVGGILEGMGKGLTAALPQMGQDLSDFMEAAGVFFEGVKNLDENVVKNTGLMVAAIAELSSLAGANGLDNFFSVGHSLPTLGSDLSAFMSTKSRY